MIISCSGAREFFFLPNVRNIFSSRLRFRFFFTRTTVFFSNDIEAGIGYRVFFVLWEVESSTFPTYIYIVSMRVRANIPDQDSVSFTTRVRIPLRFSFFSSGETLCVRTRSTYLPSMTGSTFLQIEKIDDIFLKINRSQ